jgi:Asparagine synthase (glutamine-hydrolyzing)
MRQALEIYGPHRTGQWDGEFVSLGIRLFRMVPEDCRDHQPLVGGGGRFVLVADVRLDNRQELAAELGWPPERIREAADADYVMAAWERWQDGCLGKLVGDWALAVWDAHTRIMTLARDLVGLRPLFYHAGRDFFAFASMAKGLHALPEIPAAPDPDTLRGYLAQAPQQGAGSFFKDIFRVELGGKVLLHADGRITRGFWYDWSSLRERAVSDDAACIEEFRSIFDRAVSDRLRTDGRIGCHLSSGFDSTAVTVTAAQMLQAEGKRLTAYTFVPASALTGPIPTNKLADEGGAAAATAAHHSNIDHVRINAADALIGDSFDAAFDYQEIPSFRPAYSPFRDECFRRMSARGESVLLTGSLGNTTLSRTGLERLYDEFGRGHFRTWLHEAAGLCRRGARGPAQVLRLTLKPLLPSWLTRSQFTPYLRDGVTALEALLVRIVGRIPFGEMNKGDLAAFGVDVRDPTADRRLIEFSLSLPLRFWLRDGKPKWLYHQAFRSRVPEAVLQSRLRGLMLADFPGRLERSKPRLEAQIGRVLNDPLVRALVDVEFLAAFAAQPLPSEAEILQQEERYFANAMTTLSAAHFICRARGEER